MLLFATAKFRLQSVELRLVGGHVRCLVAMPKRGGRLPALQEVRAAHWQQRTGKALAAEEPGPHRQTGPVVRHLSGCEGHPDAPRSGPCRALALRSFDAAPSYPGRRAIRGAGPYHARPRSREMGACREQ